MKSDGIGFGAVLVIRSPSIDIDHLPFDGQTTVGAKGILVIRIRLAFAESHLGNCVIRGAICYDLRPPEREPNPRQPPWLRGLSRTIATGQLSLTWLTQRGLARSLPHCYKPERISAGMTFALAVLRFINLFSAALIAGTQVLVFMVVLPVMRRWPPIMSLQTHQAMLFGTPDKYIVPSAIVCPLSAIVILLLRHKPDLASLCDVIGVLAAAAVTIASVAFAEPLSRRIMALKDASAPDGYAQIQQRWDKVHSVRTVAALLMTGAFIAASLTM